MLKNIPWDWSNPLASSNSGQIELYQHDM